MDRNEGIEEIRRGYKEKLLHYHPDRVLYLGREFQEIPERKTKEIAEAFEEIRREREDGFRRHPRRPAFPRVTN